MSRTSGDAVAQQRRSFAALYRRGVLAALPAVLASSALSVLLNWPWALEPIAERIMMLTPVDLSQHLLLHLGAYARPLALFGGLAVLIAIGGLASALAGDLARRGAVPRSGMALCFLLATLFVLFPPLSPLPTAIFVILYLSSLVAPLLRRIGARDAGERTADWPEAVPLANITTAYGRAPDQPAQARAAPAPMPSTSQARRAFVSDSARILGATAILVALLLIEPWYRSMTIHRRGGRLFALQMPPPRQPGFDLAGLTPEVTPPDRFYYLSKNLVDPDLSAEDWTLRVVGLVARPLLFRFDDLLALPARSLWVTQECVSNPVGGPLMSCALFTGVPLARLLLRAGPLSSATQVVMRAPDGHADSIPLTLALQPDVLVAYGMDGAYLERAHGYPARVLIPGSYGFKSVKWVDHLELVDYQFKGTWQALGWSAQAIVQTMARIDLVRRTAGGLLVAGIAFAGVRGIRAVQVRAEGGVWRSALLHTPPLSPFTWVQWRLTLPLTRRSPAHVTLEARAIDGTGAAQEARQRDIYPAGATGYHRVTVIL